MANDIRLEVYSFQVRPVRDTKNFKDLDALTNEHDFMKFFGEYINSFQIFVNEVQKKSIQFIPTNAKVESKKKYISGIVESGDYGVESKIVDKNTYEEMFKRLPEHLDIKPFYFLLHIPEKSKLGYLVLQRLGIYGISTIFTSHLFQYFRQKFDDLLIEFNPLISKKLAETFLEEGVIQTFTLRRFNLPSDIIDKIDSNLNEDLLSIELKFTAKPKRWFKLNKRVSSFVNDPKAAFFDIPELRSLGFDEHSESKIKVKFGHQTQTIDLSDTGQIRPYYYIDHEVQKEASGHPNFDSIDSMAKTLLAELIRDDYA